MQGDVEIVHSAIKGDPVAFQHLVEKYKNAVYGVILPKVRDFHQAQDLASETFIQAYLSLESLEKPEKLGLWLCGIARNVTGKWIAREKRDDVSLEQWLENHRHAKDETISFYTTAIETPEEVLEQNHIYQLVWQGLYSLPEISQEILILFYMRDMSQSEIARFLDISLTAVRNRLSDARKRLKKEMLKMVKNTVQDHPLPENFTERILTEAMKRGREYLAHRNWEKAKEQFQRAVDIQEDYAPAYKGLGMAAKGMIDEQLDDPKGMINRQLLEDAFVELAKSYRLGARDADTVWTLARLYFQFNRHDEYVDLLWDFAFTSDDIQEAFRAGYQSIGWRWSKNIIKLGKASVEECIQIIEQHRVLLDKFAGKISPTEQLSSYVAVYKVYSEIGRFDDWLKKTEDLVEKIGDEMLLEPYYYYMRDRALELNKLGRNSEAIQTARRFIDWAQSLKYSNPRKRFFIVDIKAILMWFYHQTGDQQKVEETLADAQETIQQHELEWNTAVVDITDEGKDMLKRLNKTYGMVQAYNDKTTVAEVRDWLNQIYPNCIRVGMFNLALYCYLCGKGETSIDIFNKIVAHNIERGKQVDGGVYEWLAMLMLGVRKDRESSLEYLKLAMEDRRYAVSGSIKRSFETNSAYNSVRDDEEFLAVVNANVIS